MGKPYFEDIFNYPIEEFKMHLEEEDNSRIIFSGRYGVRKTRILEDFFQSGNQQKILSSEKYNVYGLSPVKYAVVYNEDIMEYLKYDIITEFLRRGYATEQKNEPLFSILPEFLKKHADDVMATICYMVLKVGKEVAEVWEKIKKLREEWLAY